MGQALVIADAHRHLIGGLLGRLPEGILQVGVPAAQQCQLDAQLTHLRQRLQDKVGPLLAGQPADHDRQHTVRIDREAQLLLHAGLVLDLAAQVMKAVVGTDQRVGLRIPDRLVNAVEDAREALAPLQQHALHAGTALRRGDLVGIARADRAQPVGKHQPALHEAALPVIFQAAGHPRPQDMRRQVQPRRLLQREEPLVDQVMDAEHGLHPAHRVQRQIHRRQPRVPVMRMQDVGLPPGIDVPPGQMRPHPAQQRKSPDVVGPVAVVRAQIGVAFAPEVPGGIHHVGGKARVLQAPM